MQTKSQDEKTKRYPKLSEETGLSDVEIEMVLGYEVSRGIAYFMAWAHNKAISRGRNVYNVSPNRKQRRTFKKRMKKLQK